jgi:hypothetical protein
MQQRLTLPLAAPQISGLAILPDLRRMPADRLPAFDLAFVLGGHAPAHVIPAVPLEPAARIVFANPSLAPPFRKWPAGIDPEEIERIENFKDIISFDSKDINEHMKFMAKLFEDKKKNLMDFVYQY